jgi:signal transduction histidine kinase
MFSRISESFYRTAAWRLGLRSTLVFAAGSAAVFLGMYAMVAQSVRERSDAWLIGESETLKQVAMTTPKDSLYNRIVEEVAELASQEMAYDSKGNHHTDQNTVFFIENDPAGQHPVWVGPTNNASFLHAIQALSIRERQPVSMLVAGWRPPFRVVAADMPSGGRVFLGLQDTSATELLNKLLFRFFLGWLCMVTFGFVIAVLGLRRTLKRVDAITSAAAGIGTADLSSRVTVGRQNDEITRLSRTFNNMLDRISASVNQLRTLTDSVAHDLKSPITSVRGSLEFALSTEDEELSHELLAKAIEGLDRMSDIVTTSLDVAEAEAGALRLRLEQVDLAELVGRVVELYSPAFAERHQTLEIQKPYRVEAQVDVRMVTRMLSNLLENEMRYAGDGARVLITLEEREQKACLCVEDNGEGFPPELLGSVFQRFAKGRNSDGYGLGLALVNAVATAHGGTARARNLLAGGAEVSVELALMPSTPMKQSYSDNLANDTTAEKERVSL